MKLFHLSDLHLGKNVNGFNMLEDQKYILQKIVESVDSEKPQVIMIAGDVYDKGVPSEDAVKLFDDFLNKLFERGKKVFVISGNHDSAVRVSFGTNLMKESGIYFSPAFNGTIEPVKLEDEFGEVNFYMLPFVKPLTVKQFFAEEKIENYNDAVKLIVNKMKIDEAERNVLIAHQFVTGAVRSDSEDISIGGLDNVDAEVFDSFDYVALGHIHRPQKILKETVRYSGTPLKYSFSEADDKKSIAVIELNEKNCVEIKKIPLVPLRDMREMKGKYEEIVLKKNYENTNLEDYVHVTLTDEEIVPFAFEKLSAIFPNIMKLDYDNKRTRENREIVKAKLREEATELERFSDFYELMNNQKLNDEQVKYMTDLIEAVKGE